MIKINLIREGRAAVRGAAATGGAVAAAAGPPNINSILIVVFLIAGLVIGGGYWLWKHRVEKAREDEVTEKTAEAQKLESIIKEVEDFQKRKDSLEKRIALINELKKNQKGPVRVLDRISQDLPDLVWLDKMTLGGAKISLEGRALNPNAVATYVENIKHDPMFEEPDVSGLTQENAGTVTVYRWAMTFGFKYSSPEATTAPGTAPAAGTPGGATTTSGTAAPATATTTTTTAGK